MSDDESTEIRIELPLPLDITATLISIVGLTWPHAVIKDGGKGRPHYENRLVLSIPQQDRHKTIKKAAKYVGRKHYLNANADSVINSFGPGDASVGLPEYLSSILLSMAKGWVALYPEAENYIETKVYDKEERTTWVLTVARDTERTPHELRKKAEARIAELEAELAQLKEAARV